MTYLNQSRILAYEVGNEPNLYTYTGLRLDTYDLAHYANYNGSTFTKLVILNTHLYNDTSSTRPHKFINVALVLGQRVQVRRLTGPSSVAKTGITWKGQFVSDVDGTVVGEEVVERVADGVVGVRASEGVVIQVDRL